LVPGCIARTNIWTSSWSWGRGRPHELVGLKQELSDAIGVEVDLVTRDALKPRIGQRILSGVVML
jgi:predicted nucleotidyltransferase